MPNTIGIFIANLNRKDLTRDVISDLLLQDNKNFKIYLFDQGSTENNTIGFLRWAKEWGGVTVIRNERNIPLNHLWSEFKTMCYCPYLCFLNNDIRIPKNFTKDDAQVLDYHDRIGITIHQTNHPDHLKEINTLIWDEFKSFYQGWAFTIRRELMPEIPKELKLFYGDDYIFSKVNKAGKSIAFIRSSPMIHLCQQSHSEISNTNELMRSDAQEFDKIVEQEGLRKLYQMVSTGQSRLFPAPNTNLT